MNTELLERYLKTSCFGREKRISGAALRRILHVSETELHKRVTRLRRQGVPIASCREGYFYAANAGELFETIRYLEQIEAGLKETAAGLIGAMERFGEEAEQSG